MVKKLEKDLKIDHLSVSGNRQMVGILCSISIPGTAEMY